MKKFQTKQTGVLSAAELKTFKGKFLYWAFFVVLFVVMIISVVPTIWTVLTAFKTSQEIYSSFSFFPKGLTFAKAAERFLLAWNELEFGESVINTFALSFGDIIFKLVICGFGGYSLSKLNPKGGKLIFTLVVWTMMMPSQIRMVPNYISYLHFPFAAEYEVGGIKLGMNILDTFWPMWLSQGADAYMVLLFKNSFDGLSKSYVEAAKIDGCSNYGIFFKIMFPLSIPIVVYMMIGAFNVTWSDYMGPLLILDSIRVVPLDIYKLKLDQDIKMNTYFMALVIGSIAPFVMFTIFNKQIMGGINVGGVKE